MNRTVTLGALVVAAALLAPVGAATWGSYGSQEPDNKYDANGLHMRTAPPGGATDLVYFNVFTSEAGAAAPNDASTGGRVHAVADSNWEAILGVWVDCNGDGYVGLADGALTEYRVEESLAAGHPVNTVLCPVTKDGAPGASHNYNNWITELIPIGPASFAPVSADNRQIVDSTAAIWGDRTQPNGADIQVGAGQCTILFGAGQMHHTGGVLQHADCLDGAPADVAVGVAKSRDPTGLTNAIPQPSSLYADGGVLDKPTFGTEQDCKDGRASPCGTGNSNAIVYGESDCSKNLTSVFVPTVGTLVVHPVGVPQVNPSGNLPATYNETANDVPVLEDCNNSNGNFPSFYQAEVANQDAPATGKNAVDYSFSYNSGSRLACGGAQSTTCDTPVNTGVAPVAYAEGGAVGALLHASYSNYQWGPSGWTGNGGLVGYTPSVLGSTKATTQQFDASPADWYTFYAHVGVTGYDLLPVSTYGSEWCSDTGANAPNEHGWICDSTQWNLNGVTGIQGPGPKVGDDYEFRDVDCYDNAVVAASDSPTHADVGPRSAPLVTNSTSGCW